MDVQFSVSQIGIHHLYCHRSFIEISSLQELIRNKARNGQNCCLLEEAYAMVSALPQRSENTHHVSMIENYPATLEVLGEPIRQVDGVTVAFLISTVIRGMIVFLSLFMYVDFFFHF